jgi:23S rRNA (adenine2503-C2)-methyltransferase
VTDPDVPSVPARYAATRADLDRLLRALGEPSYRAAQLDEGLWRQRRPLATITSIAASLRADLDALLPLSLTAILERTSQIDATTKFLWQVAGGDQVETVVMPTTDRATVCVSSQSGCAMGCTFCATGQAGFDRHLSAVEIVEQVVRAQHATEPRVSNVVFMGMGEPLANLDEVEAAIVTLHDRLGISARRIVVSTVGIVPGIERLRDFMLPVTLAVSLHAPDDALRDTIVPVNRRYPIADVLDAAARYVAAKGRRVSFEYACIAGVNDRPHHATALAGRLGGFPGGAHVNLIPLNATDGYPGGSSQAGTVETFASTLAACGVTVTVRRNRGSDIDAACGQLRMRRAGAPKVRESHS